jgi:Mce-associated membrane protein
MADDAAAPDGELTEASSAADGAEADKSGAVEPQSAGTEPESTATLEDANEDAAEPDAVDSVEDDGALGSPAERPAKARMSHVRVATIIGLVAVLALAGLTGWLGYGAYHAYKADEQRKLFLQVGRQGAINLTTIDWQHAEADVQRVLDSATGPFYDEFQGRAEPFVAVVKQAQSKSVGTVTEAGVEEISGDQGTVLVAVTVETSNLGAPEQQPRAWRMRITVQKDGDDNAKVSDVKFVS